MKTDKTHTIQSELWLRKAGFTPCYSFIRIYSSLSYIHMQPKLVACMVLQKLSERVFCDKHNGENSGATFRPYSCGSACIHLYFWITLAPFADLHQQIKKNQKTNKQKPQNKNPTKQPNKKNPNQTKIYRETLRE